MNDAGRRNEAADTAPHGSAWVQWGILVQGQVRAKPVVVRGIVAQHIAQVALIDKDRVIQAIPSDRFADLKAQNIFDNWPTLTRWINKYAFPPPIRPTLFDLDEVDAWLQSRRSSPQPPKAA